MLINDLSISLEKEIIVRDFEATASIQ